jgi:hypothetical protein
MIELDQFYRNNISNLLLTHLEIAGWEAEKIKKSDFEENYMKLLKFQSRTDWKKFRANVDLFEDTEYAIISAFRFQLGDMTLKNRDYGELNIRLYGILNAVYLQIRALIELSKLLNYPNPKEIEKSLKSLDVYKLRGIAGSHTVNFELDDETKANNPGINKITTFRIAQACLNKTGDKIMAINENGITMNFNLLEVLSEYVKYSTDLLVNLIRHSIESLLRKKKDKLQMNDRLEKLLMNLVEYSDINENRMYKDKLLNKYLNTSPR